MPNSNSTAITSCDAIISTCKHDKTNAIITFLFKLKTWLYNLIKTRQNIALSEFTSFKLRQAKKKLTFEKMFHIINNINENWL